MDLDSYGLQDSQNICHYTCRIQMLQSTFYGAVPLENDC